MKRGRKCENLCRKANLHIPAVRGVCGVPVRHGVFAQHHRRWRGVADADCNCPGRTLAGRGKVERKAVRMDYTQLVKRLRWTAANDEQVFDAETAMLAAQAIETMQAQLEQDKQALAMMWFAYENKNTDCPHGFEAEAVQAAQGILGTWKECMPKYLGRGAKEG